MSVIRSDRSVSTMEFLHTARELEIYSIKKCVCFPKRYNFYINQSIARSAAAVYENAKKGNSIFPANKHEAQQRKDFFVAAYCELQNLISQLEVANELFGVDLNNAMAYWMELINKEINLIKAVLKKDKERFKDLP